MNKVTTIINKKKQFLWSEIRKNLMFLLPVLLFTACVKNEKFKTESYRTTSGYGYSIVFKNKIIIKQSVIPVISDNKSFATKSDALKVAHLVVDKLNHNISPTVTKNDLILLKIKL